MSQAQDKFYEALKALAEEQHFPFRSFPQGDAHLVEIAVETDYDTYYDFPFSPLRMGPAVELTMDIRLKVYPNLDPPKPREYDFESDAEVIEEPRELPGPRKLLNRGGS